MMLMVPSKPWLRSSSAARKPARDPPTTTTRRRPLTRPLRSTRGSFLDRDRLLGAPTHRLLHLGPQLLARLLLEHVEEVVVPNLEDLRGGRHAQGVALAQIEIDDHSHKGLLLVGTGRTGVLGDCGHE